MIRMLRFARVLVQVWPLLRFCIFATPLLAYHSSLVAKEYGQSHRIQVGRTFQENLMITIAAWSAIFFSLSESEVPMRIFYKICLFFFFFFFFCEICVHYCEISIRIAEKNMGFHTNPIPTYKFECCTNAMKPFCRWPAKYLLCDKIMKISFVLLELVFLNQTFNS